MRTTKDYAQYADARSPLEASGAGMKNYRAYQAALKNDRGDRERWYAPTSKTRLKEWQKMELPQIWENVLGHGRRPYLVPEERDAAASAARKAGGAASSGSRRQRCFLHERLQDRRNTCQL